MKPPCLFDSLRFGPNFLPRFFAAAKPCFVLSDNRLRSCSATAATTVKASLPSAVAVSTPRLMIWKLIFFCFRTSTCINASLVDRKARSKLQTTNESPDFNFSRIPSKIGRDFATAESFSIWISSQMGKSASPWMKSTNLKLFPH